MKEIINIFLYRYLKEIIKNNGNNKNVKMFVVKMIRKLQEDKKIIVQHTRR